MSLHPATGSYAKLFLSLHHLHQRAHTVAISRVFSPEQALTSMIQPRTHPLSSLLRTTTHELEQLNFDITLYPLINFFGMLLDRSKPWRTIDQSIKNSVTVGIPPQHINVPSR
jgi:hypothetical protein